MVRPVENAPPLNAVILTLGLYTLIVAIAGMIWGNTPRSFPAAFSLRGYTVGGTTLLFTPNDTFIVLVVIAVAAALAFLFRGDVAGAAHARCGVRARGGAAARGAGRADADARLGARRDGRVARRRARRAVGVRRSRTTSTRS